MARKVKGESLNRTGTSGDDILSGEGGSYELVGGKGNDTYIVDDAGDSITERRNGGTDTVLASIDFELGDDIENLTLTGTAQLGTGNELDNVIIGNSGDNSLYGLDGDDTLEGGGGDDLLDGGAGTDTAVFEGDYTSYSFEWSGDDLIVTSENGEVDTLRNIEYLVFADQTVAATDITTSSAAAVALQAANDTASVMEDGTVQIQVLDNDLGDGIAISAVDYSGTGQVTVNADGTLTYVPASDWAGIDTFSYTITDSSGASATAMVSVDVAAVNDAPIAANETFAVDADTQFVSPTGLLANDSDVDGDSLSVTLYDSISANGGSVQVNADGSFSFMPAAGFTGTDSFTYTVSDGNGGSDTATVTLDVLDGTAEEIPYYVSGMLRGEEYRLNPGDPVGTAVTVTFAFADATPDYYYDGSFAWNSFEAFSDDMQTITRNVLADISEFTNVTFVETSVDDAGIVFGIADIAGTGRGLAYYPDGNLVGRPSGDVWIDSSLSGLSFEPGTLEYVTLMHEIGHALGLQHPDLPGDELNQQFTTMEDLPHWTFDGLPDAMLLYDVAALQYLYGANGAATAGDDVYTFDMLSETLKTIWDAGGHDTIDLSAATQGVQIDLHAGAFSTVSATGTNNISLAYNTVVEDAVGSAYDDGIVGNSENNVIFGGAGNDIMTGDEGADVFVFGGMSGTDRITDFTQGEDTIQIAGPETSVDDLTIAAQEYGLSIEYSGGLIELVGVQTLYEQDLVFEIV